MSLTMCTDSQMHEQKENVWHSVCVYGCTSDDSGLHLRKFSTARRVQKNQSLL